MSLRASVENQGEITVISLEGKMDFENQELLKDSIFDLAKQGHKILVDMAKLNFVGSSGITHFIRSLYELQEKGLETPQLCNVKSEFRRVISAYDSKQGFAIHESRKDAVDNFFRPRQNWPS